MGKKSKRKAQDTNADSAAKAPKKTKLETANGSEKKTKIKKNVKQLTKDKTNKSPPPKKETQTTPRDKKGQFIKTKNALKAKVAKTGGNQSNKQKNKTENTDKTEKQYIIPPELAKNLHKKMRQAISKKVRNIISSREASGEKMSKEDIYKLVQDLLATKSENIKDKKEKPTNMEKPKKEKLKKKKKGQ